MYTLKSIAKRGATLSAAFVLVVSSLAASAAPAFADSLNPLTHRSLTLSSSSPGWSNTDGSGNSTYAPPNSGANGGKTGNTFQFNVSTDTTSGTTKVKTMTFQYCTTSAGLCRSPGDDTSAGVDTASTTDLKVTYPSAAELDPGDFGTVVDTASGNVKAVPGYSNPNNPSDTSGEYAAKNVTGNFVVYRNVGGTWTQSTGWTMSVVNAEDATADPGNGTPIKTNQNNYIILKNATGEGFAPSQDVKVIFFGTANNYIQNPGSGAFFVKINTYKVAYDGSTVTTADLAPQSDTNVIDGGVTVANVMNQSIQITTKVLETMQFSVGTVDPNTLSSTDGDPTAGTGHPSSLDQAVGVTANGNTTSHTPCDPILTAKVAGNPQNVLQLGNQSAESSLEVAKTYATHSYWRLSSNSSAGATVYYSGHTLSNTVGDQIKPIGATAKIPAPGSEQFGLAIANDTAAPVLGTNPVTGDPQTTGYQVDYSTAGVTEHGADDGLTSVDASTTSENSTNASYHAPQLYPLVAGNEYKNGAGTLASAKFAFDSTSDTVPVALATEPSQVVDCVTAKMRYIGNIAATTPAGIYTTKINYIAAPQY